jgi:hypothetical protein
MALRLPQSRAAPCTVTATAQCGLRVRLRGRGKDLGALGAGAAVLRGAGHHEQHRRCRRRQRRQVRARLPSSDDLAAQGISLKTFTLGPACLLQAAAAPADTAPDAVYIRAPLPAGDTRHAGNVVVLGDVPAGCRIAAGGDIVVMGRWEGRLVHCSAGAPGARRRGAHTGDGKAPSILRVPARIASPSPSCLACCWVGALASTSQAHEHAPCAMAVCAGWTERRAPGRGATGARSSSPCCWGRRPPSALRAWWRPRPPMPPRWPCWSPARLR